MKQKENIVFIASSIDGYIADKNGGIDWLNEIPNPDKIDMGYHNFIAQIDALVMGRTTFETVLSFGIDWPYTKPVFVLSTTLKTVPEELKNKVFIVNGSLTQVLKHIHQLGYFKLYIDGGKTIQSFLKEDLIDRMILTTIPTLLGEGFPLFTQMSQKLDFTCISSQIYLDTIVQNTFVRRKDTSI